MKTSHKVWWLCMLPSFAAMAMLAYEYSLVPADTRLLIYTMLCPLIGMVFGAAIVGLNHGTQENKSDGDKRAETSPPSDNLSTSERAPVSNKPAQASVKETQATVSLASKVMLRQDVVEAPPERASVNSVEQDTEDLEPELPAKTEEIVSEEESVGEQCVSFPELDMLAAAESAKDITPEQETLTAMEKVARESSAPQQVETNQNDGLPSFSTSHEWLSYAEQLYDQANYDQAIKCFDKVIALDPENFEAWYQKSLALSKKGRKEDALYCLNYCSRIRDNSPVVFAEKGSCLLELGRTEQALVCFDKSLLIDKIAVKPWLGKGRCLCLMGKHKDAIDCYDKVLTLQPENEEAQKSKAELSKKLSRK